MTLSIDFLCSFIKTKFSLDLLYCGEILENEEILKEKGIRNGSMIHVIMKAPSTVEPEHEKFTEVHVQEILALWKSVHNTNFQKSRQPEFMKSVLDAHPEIRKDLWALSVLKDPILLSSMQQPETIRNIGEHHRTMINASRTIVNLLNSKKISKINYLSSALDDPLSSDSTDEDNQTSPSTSAGDRTARRITTEQLASALANAGNSYNSLSNISQRSVAAAQESQPVVQSAQNTPSTSNQTRITPSMVMSAISEVLNQTRREPGASSTAEQPVVPQIIETQEPMDTTPASQYELELRQMREMGLTDERVNLQALTICNGDVEAAINLVFSGMI
jgi:hypothetical protein